MQDLIRKSLFQIRRKSVILAEGNGVDMVRTLHCGPYTVEWNVPVIFEMNPGGHFQNIPGRIAQRIDQLMKSAH